MILNLLSCLFVLLIISFLFYLLAIDYTQLNACLAFSIASIYFGKMPLTAVRVLEQFYNRLILSRGIDISNSLILQFWSSRLLFFLIIASFLFSFSAGSRCRPSRPPDRARIRASQIVYEENHTDQKRSAGNWNYM